jgi:protein disulfide-isomerase A1
MTKQQLPAVSLLTSGTLEEFKTTDKVVVVAYIAADDKTSNTTYTTLAESLRDEYIFGASNDAALAKVEGVKQPGIVLYKDFDEGKATFDKKFEDESIKSFIKTASTPLVGEVGPETYASYMGVSCTSWAIRLTTNMSRRLVSLSPTFSPRLLKNEPPSPRPSSLSPSSIRAS